MTRNDGSTLVTELAESGAGNEVIMSIAGHVSRAMLSRYSHVRMEAKRRALDEIATRQNAAEAKRKENAELAGPSCGNFSIGSSVIASRLGLQRPLRTRNERDHFR